MTGATTVSYFEQYRDMPRRPLPAELGTKAASASQRTHQAILDRAPRLRAHRPVAAVHQ